MKDRPSQIDDESLERLIDAEVDSALVKFRSDDLETDVRRRVGERTGRKGGLARLRAVPEPVWIATAVIIFACGLILLTHPRKMPQTDLGVAIENVLRRTPGSLVLEREGREPRQPEEGTVSPVNGRIIMALMKAHQSSASISLPDKAGASPGTGRKLRPMTLEEIYKILFIDRSVERVLALTS